MIIKVNHRVKDTDIVCEQKWQAMPVLIHSAHRGKNPDVISPSALLVEGSPPSPLGTQIFNLWLRVLVNAFDCDQLTAGRGLFLSVAARSAPSPGPDPRYS